MVTRDVETGDLEDFRSPADLTEHVQSVLQQDDWALSRLVMDYRLIVPGLLLFRVPDAGRVLSEYAQANPKDLPVVILSRFPVVSLVPGRSCDLDRHLYLFPQESWLKFSECLLNSSFVDRSRDLVIWPDFDSVRIPASENGVLAGDGSQVRGIDAVAVILRSNHGAWRFRPEPSGLATAWFNRNDSGVVRMRQLAGQLGIRTPSNPGGS